MIAIHFGKQLVGSMYDEVHEWALEYDLSIEDATTECYKYMTWSLSEVNNNWQSHFDIMFSSIFKCLVVSPDVVFDISASDGLETPTLLLKSNYVTERYTGLKHLITTKVMDEFGEGFEKEFGLEYLGSERCCNKKASLADPIKNDYRSRPQNSVVYLINNNPHYYDGKRFFPVIAAPILDKVQ